MTEDYGTRIAREKAAKNREKKQNKKPAPLRKTTKKTSNPPNLKWDPLVDYENEFSHTIDWENSSTVNAAENVLDTFNNNAHQLVLLKLGTGTGKTAISILAAAKMQEKLGKKLPLIIATTAKNVEGGGFHKTIKSYNAYNEANALTPALIVSVDRLANALEHPATYAKILKYLGQDGLLILDEVQKYKTPTSKRSKKLQKLSHVKKLGLSATPLTNDIVMDGGSYLIMAGFYRNKTDFMKTTGLDWLKGGPYNELMIYNKDGTVNENIWVEYPHFLNKLSEVIISPEVVVQDLDMPNVLHYPLNLERSERLIADITSLGKAQRDRKFDSFNDYYLSIIERIGADEVRLNKLIEIVMQDFIKQPLIFYWHNEVRDSIIKKLTEANIPYQLISGETNFDDVDVEDTNPILIQYLAGAESIELKNSNTSIFYQNQTSYMTLNQAQGRNVRRGMATINKIENTHQYYLISDLEFDQELFERVMQREEIAQKTLEEIVKRTIG